MGTPAPTRSTAAVTFFSVLLICTVFFPYLSPFPTASDTQPIALLLGVVGLFLLLSHEDRFPVSIWMLAIPFATSVLMSLYSGISFEVVRNVSGYASLFILSMVAHLIFRRREIDLGKYLPWFAGVWLGVGIVQILFDRQFGTFFLGDVRTTSLRGATSLSPEPTFFATALLFIIFFSLTAPRPRMGIVAACTAGILFVAQSAQITLVLMMGVLTFALVRILLLQLRAWHMFLAVIFSVAIYFIVDSFSNTRIFSVLQMVAENPATLTLIDASANNRASHILISFHGFVDNFFLPHGVHRDAWVEYFYQQVSARPDLFWFAFPGDQIMSGYGKAFFELGFLSFLIFVTINSCLLLRSWPSVALKWSMIIMVNLLLISAIPLSHPMIPVLLAWLSADPAQSRWADASCRAS